MSVENKLDGVLRFSQRMDWHDQELPKKQPEKYHIEPINEPDNPQRRIFLSRQLPVVALASIIAPGEILSGRWPPENESLSPLYAFISPNNPVLTMPANPNLDKQDPNDIYKRLVETVYAQKNSLGEDDPRPLNRADIQDHLHPLGPYGDKMLSYARKYAQQIGLPADVLATYIASESFHESLWNGTSNQTSPEVIKRAVTAGYGIMQLMTREDGLGPGAPYYHEVDTVDKQLDWVYKDILKASNIVRARGRQFTMRDLNYYFVGQSTGTNDIYDRFEAKMIADTRIFLRNMALFDPTGHDLIYFFEVWQSQNNDSAAKSRDNFRVAFDSLTYPAHSISVPHGEQKTNWHPSPKVLQLAYYLNLKYQGSYTSAVIDRQLLVGFSNEEIYWALAANDSDVINYSTLAHPTFKPYQTEVENGKSKTYIHLEDFLLHPSRSVPQKQTQRLI